MILAIRIVITLPHHREALFGALLRFMVQCIYRLLLVVVVAGWLVVILCAFVVYALLQSSTHIHIT